jgi:hypothetical protein
MLASAEWQRMLCYYHQMMSLLALKIAPKERFLSNNIKLKGIKFKTFKTKQNFC